MFSRLASSLVVLVLGLSATGCGHKAPPTPPPLKNPAQTTDLAVLQRGETAVLSFSFPQTTLSGLPVGEIRQVEIWQLREEVPEFLQEGAATDDSSQIEGDNGIAGNDDPTSGEVDEGEADPESEEPEEAGEDEEVSTDEGDDSEDEEETEFELAPLRLEEQTAPDPLEFVVTATLIETLEGEELSNATHGTKLYHHAALETAEHEQWSITFGIKTYGPTGAASTFSNIATLVQRTAPVPPEGFEVEPEPTGIRVSWNNPEVDDEDKEDAGDEAPLGYRVYRRSSATRTYGEPLAKLSKDANEHFDRSATFGERYIYAVTAIGHENPTLESFFAGAREIEYTDRFEPKAPRNLIAFAQEGRVRLLWDANPEADIAGYVIFRRDPGGDFLRITDEAILGVEYNDRTVAAGTTYDYRIAAVDKVGNQSEASESVVARVP